MNYGILAPSWASKLLIGSNLSTQEGASHDYAVCLAEVIRFFDKPVGGRARRGGVDQRRWAAADLRV